TTNARHCARARSKPMPAKPKRTNARAVNQSPRTANALPVQRSDRPRLRQQRREDSEPPDKLETSQSPTPATDAAAPANRNQRAQWPLRKLGPCAKRGKKRLPDCPSAQ